MSAAERNPNIDLVKTVAMLCVIGLHCFIDYKGGISGQGYEFFYRSCVVAVPLFFMVSGWLLLPKPSLTWAYAWRKILAILRVTLLAFIILYIVVAITNGLAVEPRQIPEHFLRNLLQVYLQVEEGYTGPLWFFGALIIVYLFAPWLGRVYRCLPSAFSWLFAASAALTFAVAVFNCVPWLPARVVPGIEVPFEINFCQVLRLWNWIFYFLLGGILRRPRVSAALRPAGTFPMVVALLILNDWSQRTIGLNAYGNYYCEYYYSSPLTQVLCAVTFVWLMSVRLPRPCKPLQAVAPLFLPVYLFHLEVVYYFMSRISNVALLWLATTVVILALSALLMRIPLARRAFTI